MLKRPIYIYLFLFLLPAGLYSCSIEKKIARTANEQVLQTAPLKNAQVGICIFEPATGKYWYQHQGDKYFVPASNTKIPTLYAALKHLGDSLVGARYKIHGNSLMIYGTGDPTFLHRDYNFQPVMDFIRANRTMDIQLLQNGSDQNNQGDQLFKRFGSGWAWSDYDADYMAERSFFPMYGNVVRFSIDSLGKLQVSPSYFQPFVTFIPDEKLTMSAMRDEQMNLFFVNGNKKGSAAIEVPYLTEIVQRFPDGRQSRQPGSLFSEVVGKPVHTAITASQYRKTGWLEDNLYGIIRSQPLDSMLKPMMHRSDNFFAEQVLLMISNERFGFMSDRKIIDTLLATDLAALPQKPRWADGSGLSRYNLFTPQDFVFILGRMKEEFGMDRLKNIFATGGEGTITNYYKSDAGFIYGKTGTLSGVVAFSGFLYTKKGKLLIFSTLVNNHNGSATDVRRRVEKFLQTLRVLY